MRCRVDDHDSLLQRVLKYLEKSMEETGGLPSKLPATPVLSLEQAGDRERKIRKKAIEYRKEWLADRERLDGDFGRAD